MNDDDRPIKVPTLAGKDGLERPLPKRFYAVVSVETRADGYTVKLDARVARTPAKRELALPTGRLAEAVAAEWRSQGERIDPAAMPLTRLVNTVLDGVIGRETDIRADIARYAASDLVCYRASEPAGLVHLQTERWDPFLAFAEAELGATFVKASGIMHVTQPEAALNAVRKVLAGYDAWSLAPLHVMTTLTGSALIALAHAAGHLDLAAAWVAAHADEDWQIAQWGEDAEATARRDRRLGEMSAASRTLELL